MTTVDVTVISDFVCPWCYIGKARLDRVVDLLKDEIKLNIDVWPFLLYPHIPKGGVPKSDFSNRTKPGMGRSLRSEAAKENIEINYKLIDRIPNSLEAHRLIWLVGDKNLKYRLSKKIFKAYFEKGLNIEDKVLLYEIGENSEVPHVILRQFFDTKDGTNVVAQSIQSSKKDLVTMVPSIRLDHKFLIPGLQPAEVLVKYIKRAAAKKSIDS